MTSEPADSEGAIVILPQKESLLPQESTTRLIQYLRCYAATQRNKTKAVQRLLGCSAATANRMLSKSNPYRARMKTVWAVRICAAVGKPFENVAPHRVTKTCQQALTGWTEAKTFSEALQLASDCAQSICVMAFNAFNLRGWFTVRYNHGWPACVEVSLSPCPEFASYGQQLAPHQLILTLDSGSDNKRRMFVRYFHPVHGRLDKLPLTFDRVEKFIQHIHGLTRRYANELQREQQRIRTNGTGGRNEGNA